VFFADLYNINNSEGVISAEKYFQSNETYGRFGETGCFGILRIFGKVEPSSRLLEGRGV
jgi:hypothetical protein